MYSAKEEVPANMEEKQNPITEHYREDMEQICLNYQRGHSDSLTSYVRAVFYRWLRDEYVTE